MNIAAMKQVMKRLYTADVESYNELWDAVRVLTNLGLLEDKVFDAMVKEDERLYEAAD